MNDNIHKTATANIVYWALADFSDKTDAEQVDLKSKFNALVKVVLKAPQTQARIVTDTFEGVMVASLGAPEEVLQLTANMQNIVHQYNIRTTAPVLVRTALHAGQVQIVNDIHGQPQALGDAIKLTQHMTNFAQPNEILATQAFVASTAHLMQGETNVIDYTGISNDRHDLHQPLYAMHFTEALAVLNKAFAARGPAPIMEIQSPETEPPIEVLSEFKGVHWPYVLSGMLILVGLYALVQTLVTPNEPTITMTSAEVIEPSVYAEVKKPELKQPTVFDPYGLLPNETIEELPTPQAKPEELVTPVIKPEKTIRAASQLADEESEKLARKVFAEQLKLEAQNQAKTVVAPVAEQNKLPEVTISPTDTKVEAAEAVKASESLPKEEDVKQPEAVAHKVQPQQQTKDNEKSGWGAFTGGLKKGQVRACSQAEIALMQCR